MTKTNQSSPSAQNRRRIEPRRLILKHSYELKYTGECGFDVLAEVDMLGSHPVRYSEDWFD